MTTQGQTIQITVITTDGSTHVHGFNRNPQTESEFLN